MEYLLTANNLKKYFISKKGASRAKYVLKAVNGVSFKLAIGKTLGVVGESGSGKSTLARLILNLIKPTSGEVIFEGKNVLTMPKKDMLAFRKNAQIIFQDPYSSLDPRMTAGEIVGEAIDIHKISRTKKERIEIIEKVFQDVGLDSSCITRYPHEFSGGQRQRIGIARAICLKPKLIVCDEPVSALDVSIQAQIINMLKILQNEYNLAYFFISHDLNVVRHISNYIIVMYLGKIVEQAYKEDLYSSPLHPYTNILLSSIPMSPYKIDIRKDLFSGEPSMLEDNKGCSFNQRCKMADEICFEKEPDLINIGQEHKVACHRYELNC